MSTSLQSNGLQPTRLICPCRFCRQKYWSVFPCPHSRYLPNPGLPHCRWILYQPSHQGSPRILEWVTYPFSPGELHTTRIILRCPELQEDSLPAELPGKHPSVFTAIQIIHLMTFLSFCLHATLPFQEDKRNTTEASTERKCNPNRRNAIRRK